MIYLFTQQDFQSSQHQEHIELQTMQTIPPNLQKNCNAADTSTENLGYDDDDETDSNSFTADKLFSFAWQIAQGMVMYYLMQFLIKEVGCMR